MEIIPVILAGGSGTRLWPLSRETYPKQFLKLVGERSLFQETVLRANTLNSTETIYIVCNAEHYFICLDQLEEIHITNTQFILEPFGRNTAPAIAIAALHIKHTEKAILVLPSDHLISDTALFTTSILQAKTAVNQYFLVTFGVKPTSAKTGYGYIEAGRNINHDVRKINRFIEKPNLETAQQFIQEKNFYWNAGIFLFRADAYLSELQLHSPDIYFSAKSAYDASQKNENYLRIDRAFFETCPNNSIDYAVMEKTNKAAIVPLLSAWNDLGCWSSVADANASNDFGNVQSDHVISQDSHNCYFSSDGRLIAALGLHNQIIVSTADAVLVADKSYSQAVKALVAQLKEQKNELTTHHPLVHRPWGYYEILSTGKNFKVKRIMVKPGAKLSLQTHQHRAEHWVVVSGVADVVNHEKQFLLRSNESTYIPKNTKHRLSNSHPEPLVIIEVQSGEYLGEDDIVRLDDVYERISQFQGGVLC